MQVGDAIHHNFFCIRLIHNLSKGRNTVVVPPFLQTGYIKLRGKKGYLVETEWWSHLPSKRLSNEQQNHVKRIKKILYEIVYYAFFQHLYMKALLILGRCLRICFQIFSAITSYLSMSRSNYGPSGDHTLFDARFKCSA